MKKVSVIPLGDRVLIEPIDSKEAGQTLSGLIIPETVDKERPEQGRVIAVGEGKFEDGATRPMTVKKGQKVLFSKYGPDEIKIDGEVYLIVSESNILAIIEE